MLAGNPFADLVPTEQPGVVYGPPKVPEPEDPAVVEGRRLENELKRQRLAKGDPMGEGQAKLRESEQKAAFLTTNLVGNVNLIANAVKQDEGAAAPTWGQVASGLLGQDVKNALLPDQRQVVENAQRMVVDAALTLGTGAAYTKEQIEAYRRGFFPQVGDSPAAIEAKRQSLRTAMVAARMNAGSAAPQIDQAMTALGLDSDPLAPGGGTVQFKDEQAPKPIGVSDLTTEQQAKDKAFLATNPTSEQYAAFLGTLTGKQIDADAAAERLKAAQSGKFSYSGEVVDKAHQGKVAELRKREDAFSVHGPVETLLMSGASLNLLDEASGVGNAAANLITSPFTRELDPFGAYRVGRDAERLRIADARQQLGYGGTALEIAGGFMSANPAAALAPFVNARQLIAQGAKAGAYGGALAGFGAGEGLEDSATKGLLGAGAGAALGAGVSALSSRYAPRGLDPELARIADAEQVRISQPMLEGNRRAVNRAGILEADPLAAPTIQRGFADTAEDIGAGVSRLADPTRAATPEAAGGAAQEAGRRFITRSRGVARTLYNRATRLSAGATVDAQRARATLDTELTDLRQAPETNRAEIAFLEGLRSDFDRPLTVDAIRAIRTGLRGSISQQGLTASQAEARAMRVLNSARDDIEASVPPEAARAYRRADAFYADRQEHISDVVQRFLGRRNQPLSAEDAFKRLKGMTSPGGDGRRLAAIMRNLDRDERQEVASTIASTLGRRGPQEAFSPDLLISQSIKLSPSARRVIFGPDGAESVGNLIELSRRLQTAQSQVNRSRTARPVLSAMGTRAKLFVTSLLGVGGGAFSGNATGVAAGVALGAGASALGAGRRMLSARALMNPRVSRWLAQAADVASPAQAQQAVRRLGVVISREPALAGELQPIQNFLTQRLSAAPPALADPEADGGDDD